MRKLLHMAAIAALCFAGSAVHADVIEDTAGETGSAVWTYEAVVDGLSDTITVDATEMALISTEALTEGATLELIQAAVAFSTHETGPGPMVGEFMTGNFVTGTEEILITVEDYGIYTFEARWNTVGSGGADTQQFQIEFVPEPATMAMLGLGGLAVLRRRRK